jgi:hypothetical protein
MLAEYGSGLLCQKLDLDIDTSFIYFQHRNTIHQYSTIQAICLQLDMFRPRACATRSHVPRYRNMRTHELPVHAR